MLRTEKLNDLLTCNIVIRSASSADVAPLRLSTTTPCTETGFWHTKSGSLIMYWRGLQEQVRDVAAFAAKLPEQGLVGDKKLKRHGQEAFGSARYALCCL